MPRSLYGPKYRWLVFTLAGAAILAGAALILVWWTALAPEPSPLVRGQAAYSRRDWPEAERCAREQLRKTRDDRDALRLLSRSLFRQ